MLEVIAGCINMSVAFGAGFSVDSFQKTMKVLSKDPFRYDKYEESLKNKKDNTTKDFLNYYVGMPGRILAYKYLDNSNNWE